ncbi:MAG: 2-isopropylmalate synthase [Neisseriaceae bacterium]|nr:MAG: 2-isopropylmalate synthase [Neisseriaceae bacterium]
MLQDPSRKYIASEVISFPERTWVNKTLTQPPIWLSTDLRDGNQSLFNPMSVEAKTKFYAELIKVGLKEIEVGFPAASDIDYKFVRKLIEENLIPDDVTIMVMTQARKDLILKTVEAVRGCKRVIVHIYNATAPAWREIVFGMSISQVMDLIATQVSYFKQLTDGISDTKWILQYSPETFSSTEPEVALEACNTAINAWMTNEERPIIINLPTTVENTTPNVFADRIEWISSRLQQRENVILSVHPHNDRGTGVATAELALLAGAQRVEGCLFGNGERCGNVDLVTLALNLYTQGINPALDFSNINRTAKIVEEATQLPIHPRHPYVGDLVFTAFSGSHQDAIKKGFAYQQGKEIWTVPYLPIDPSDLGRNYANIIRVNSQSGKGGIAYIMENNYGITMPRRMQIEFSNIIQQAMDSAETEMQPEQIWSLFEQTYLSYSGAALSKISYINHKIENSNVGKKINLELSVGNQIVNLNGCGNGTLDAAVNALGNKLQIISYEEKSLGSGADAYAISMIECQDSSANMTKFGVGKHSDITTASLLALINVSHRFGLSLGIE